MNPRQDEFPILFLGGAKRVSVARHIAAAFSARGFRARFFSYEIDTRVPIAEVGEVITGKRWNDPALSGHLAEIVREKGIRMIIPFVDGAVGPAGDFAARFPELKVFVPGSDAALAGIMFDKTHAAGLFERLGLPVPPTASPQNTGGFPLIAKPRRGSASKGIRIITSADGLKSLPSPDNYLIQEYIPEREEISVDCYISVRTGEILTISPRRRVETLGGEAVRSITVDDPAATALAKRTIQATGLRGAVTIQLIRDLSQPGRLLIMEINPRLGGAVVCSIGAGADIPGQIADEALGLTPRPSKAIPGTEMCRYFQEVIFRP